MRKTIATTTAHLLFAVGIYALACVLAAAAIAALRRQEAVHVASAPSFRPSPFFGWHVSHLLGDYAPSSSSEAMLEASPVLIYVVDTAVDATHVEIDRPVRTLRVETSSTALRAKPASPASSSPSRGHGTYVASLIVGKTYGLLARLSPRVPVGLVSVAAISDDGKSSTLVIADALKAIYEDVQVQRRANSKTRVVVVGSFITSTTNRLSFGLSSSVKALYDSDVLMVVAAGNQNQDACAFAPSRLMYVVTVGGVTVDGERATNSNYGKCVDVFAPSERVVGANVPSTRGALVMRDGTSASAPLVAAVAASVLHRNASLSAVGAGRLIRRRSQTALDLRCDRAQDQRTCLETTAKQVDVRSIIENVREPPRRGTPGGWRATLSSLTNWSRSGGFH